jgi:hypothetical protein
MLAASQSASVWGRVQRPKILYAPETPDIFVLHEADLVPNLLAIHVASEQWRADPTSIPEK